MRRMFTVTLLVTVLAGSLVACGSDSSDSEDEATGTGNGPDMLVFTDASTPIAVVTGQEFAIRLESNATTGYEWAITEGPSADQVRVLESEGMTEAGENTNGLAGVPGTSTFVFEANSSGSTQVSFTYARPTDPEDNPTVTTFTINVS
jgi:predicted secreted protein